MSSAGNKNRTLIAFASLSAAVFLSLSVLEMAINSGYCNTFLNVCGVSWSRMLRSCCSNDSNDNEPDVDLPGVVTIDLSGDRLLMSTEVTPLTNVKSGSSVIPISLSESLCDTKIANIMTFTIIGSADAEIG